MDSLTQGLLGAATFALVKEKEIGKRSLVIGAIVGTIPDLDVLFSDFFHEVEFLTIHRGISHSFPFALLSALFLAYIFHEIYKRKFSYWKWFLAFFLALFTHSLLDACTTYGTKLLAPFSDYLFAFNNIFIVEPIYTVTLLLGFLISWFVKRKSLAVRKVLGTALMISTLYLGWGFISKSIAVNAFQQALEDQEITYERMMVSPTPLNTLLWQGIVKVDGGYYFGDYSVLDTEPPKFIYAVNETEALEPYADNYLIKKYLEYTQGYELVETRPGGRIYIYAAKYGPVGFDGEPEFIFPMYFHPDSMADHQIKLDEVAPDVDFEKDMPILWQRMMGNQIGE